MIFAFSLTACDGSSIVDINDTTNTQTTQNTPARDNPINTDFDINTVPDYNGAPVYIVNNNIPFFKAEEIARESYETYLELDALGRPRGAIACLSKDTMPAKDEERGVIGNIKPPGWHTIKYPDVISDLYLYNRCHLIGWQLCAENDNELNLVTGTRYLNIEGMLPYENKVDDYIDETGNHVMYRATPIYEGDNLVCNGILIEAKSVEDNNCAFCVYCYNVQPYITIDYATGESYLADDNQSATNDSTNKTRANDYVLNTNSMKIHRPDCKYAKSISDNNRLDCNEYLSDLIDEGYTICKSCNPT